MEICSISDGDTSWMLLSTLLVLSMCPALALFEAGLLRSKSTMSIVTQVFVGVVALSMLWVVVGYSLVFEGNFSKVFFRTVGLKNCSPMAPKIPEAVYALFQMMFAVISPLLITGAVAERMRFRTVIIFAVLWECLVYYPIAHFIWASDGWMNKLGVLDFAGGIVIHTTSGVSALMCAAVLGKRAGFEECHGEFRPSNLPLAALGTSMLWAGWFGFNGGSALAAGSVAVSAVVSTHIAACTSGLVWVCLALWYGKASGAAVMNGVVAGLAGITPASGYVGVPATVIIAVVLGVASFYGARLVKTSLHVDDALEVSMVHGLTGAIGAISIGFAADRRENPSLVREGIIRDGQSVLLGYQAMAVAFTIAYTAAVTGGILWVMRLTLGRLRCTDDEEHRGLDYVDHGDSAYHLLRWNSSANVHSTGMEENVLPLLRDLREDNS